jgi:glycerophosphoryl diester phosphodiesterase
VSFFTHPKPGVPETGVPVPPLIVGHRGASRDEPPGNTEAAFRRARELGADWVELDVRLSADGGRVVHHDAELDDGRPICELPVDALPTHLPRLDVALVACEGLGVNVEIKNSPDDVDFDPTRSVADVVLADLAGFDRARLLVTSFDLETIDRVHAIDPSMPTGLLAWDLGEPERAIEVAAAHAHRAINPWDPFVDEAFMALARDAGLAVNVWTVNDPERMRQLIALDVDAIITDVPDVAAGILRR